MGKNTFSETIRHPSLRVLIIEDSDDDAQMIVRELKKGGFHPDYDKVETAAQMGKALQEKQWDIILCDYNLSKFSAQSAMALLKEKNHEIPLIVISEMSGEETAVECIRSGAQDWLMKSNLSRLCPTIIKELEEAKVRSRQKWAESQKEAAFEALLQSEEKHRTILQNMEEGYYEVDLRGKFTFFNDSMCRILGYPRKEMAGMSSRQVTDKENAKKLLKTFHEVHKTGEPAKGFDWQVKRQDGSIRYIEASVSLLKDSSGKAKGFRGIVRDITERRQAEESLRRSEELYTKLVDTLPDIIVRTDLKGEILFVNDYALKIGGYKREEMEGQNLLQFISPKDHENAIRDMRLAITNRLGPREYHMITKDGREIPFEVNGDVLRDQDNTIFGTVSVCRNISERKRAEKILQENEERLRGITQNLPGIIFQFHAGDNDEYEMSYADQRLKELLGIKTKADNLFPLFLSRIHKDDREKLLTSIKAAVAREAAWNFEGRVAVKPGEILWFEGLASPTRHENKLIYNGILLDINERKLAEEKFHKIFMTTPDCIVIARLKDGLLIDVNRGYEEIVGWKRDEAVGKKSNQSPLNFWVNPEERIFMEGELKNSREILNRQFEFRRRDGSVRDGVYSARSIIIDEEECLIFILQDITDHLHMDIQLRRTLESLRKAFNTTINVMISAIEMRDPYTAGHQRRCADIARAIATEMGFDQDKIDGIRMAGTIHDIGKLSIPAEILTRPTKLTKIEFSLIQEHALGGYEMLKDIESPWPLAEIIYQHHERMNGSGYPRNLKGNDILVEARILAVADVVEAMSSHRPYRASLGVDKALEEIEKNKDILYDKDVVNACLKLFREKNYKFPN